MPKQLIRRQDVDPADTWALGAIYQTRAELLADMEALKGMIPEITAYKGRLHIAENILACFKTEEKIERLTKELFAAFDESSRLEQLVRSQLGRLNV